MSEIDPASAQRRARHHLPAAPRLTPAAEQDLARRVAAGHRAAAHLAQLPEAAADPGRPELLTAIAAGRAAQEALIAANLPLVVAQAHYFAGRGLDLDDLIQEGNCGLITAAARFAAGRGTHFSTYAVPWIRQRIRRALEQQSRVIRLPSHLHVARQRLAHVLSLLTQELGREPTAAELAPRLGQSPAWVAALLCHSESCTSLDRLVGRDEEHTLGTLQVDPNAPDPVAEAEARLLGDTLGALMTRAELTRRERWILAARYGLGGQVPRTLDACAAVLGVTRERVRQVEARAMVKLRAVTDPTDRAA